jgi:uncharacterized protein YecT (DUF1311 family)
MIKSNILMELRRMTTNSDRGEQWNIGRSIGASIHAANLTAWCTLLGSSVFGCAFAAEDSCSTARTTIEINACAKEAFDRADRELNATYQLVLAEFDKPDGLGRPQGQTKKSLIQAQRHWVQFREANCFTVWLINAEGTVRVSQKLACMEELARQREQQLRRWFLSQS